MTASSPFVRQQLGPDTFWQPFRCPRCQRVGWVVGNRLSCRTGHPDAAMFPAAGEPVESPDIEAFIP